MSERPGADPIADHDAHLLARLGQALGPDPAPAGLAERVEALLVFAAMDEFAAIDQFAAMDMDQELAELLDAAAEPVGARGPGDPAERLVFEVADGSVAVELVVGRDRLDGQVLAGTPAEVLLERRDGDRAATAVDDLGRFSFRVTAGGPLPTGPARLLLRGTSSRPVTTSWFVL